MLLCIIRFWPIFLTNYYFAKFSMLSCPTNSIKLAHKYLFMQTFSLSICYESFFRAVFGYYIYRYIVKNKSARKKLCGFTVVVENFLPLFFAAENDVFENNYRNYTHHKAVTHQWLENGRDGGHRHDAE